MLGRQVNFFLGPSDQVPFEKALRSVGDMVILESRSPTVESKVRASTKIVSYGNESLRLNLVRPLDLATIRYRPIDGGGGFSCDPIVMPVVEFDRCYVSDQFIRSGRLYFIPKYHDDSRQLLSKPVSFVHWADGLIAAAKKALQKIEHNYFAGPDALRMRASGMSFEGLS